MEEGKLVVKKNIALDGKHGKPVLVDVFFVKNNKPKPVIIFCHGFKGFKDWGHFNLMANYFANQGFAFIKFNFSHNGTTPESPEECDDLEAFGNNNFSIELADLSTVIDWAVSSPELESDIDTDQLFLIGHSRGGGISILKAAEEIRVKKLVTWASICDFEKYFTKEQMEEWRSKGVIYVPNFRTGQEMPLYAQFFENYDKNKELLFLPNNAQKLDVPHLIIHGNEDETVPFSDAEKLNEWSKKSSLIKINNSNHTFGGMHPWNSNEFPGETKKVMDSTIDFLKL